MKKNKNPSFIASKKESWVKPLYTFFVVAMPALLIWVFCSSDFLGTVYNFAFWVKSLIAIGFMAYVFLTTTLLIYLKIIPINIITFAFPVCLTFMAIFLSDALAYWLRALIILPFVFTIAPFYFWSQKLEMKRRAREKIRRSL